MPNGKPNILTLWGDDIGAAFITGQSVYRTGMSKVGLPGVTAGIASS